MPILLQPSPRTEEKLSKEQQAASRICGKVDRAFEKLRRTAIKYLEAHPVSSLSEAPQTARDTALRGLLLGSINCLHSVLEIPVRI